MIECVLIRRESTEQGTPGYLVCPGHWFYSLELPWKNNEKKLSCIPEGVYKARAHSSPRFGHVYIILQVPRRSNILVHPLNVAGDVTKNYKTQSEGCIGLGEKEGRLWGQRAVLVSRPAVRRFMEILNDREFNLHIKNLFTETL